MSTAAIDYVASFTHPQVKDAALAVFKAIAQLVPEGQTTTPLIKMDDIATVAQLNRRTVWTWLKVLVEIGEVRVVDGMQGRRARYTLVHVDGADPIEEAPLPLVGATPRRSRPRRTSSDATPDLFESLASEEQAIPRSQLTQHETCDPCDPCDPPITWITWITSYMAFAITWITRITSSRVSTCDPCDPVAHPLAVDDARAGAIRKSLVVDLVEELVVDARARDPVDTFLAWWTATFPTYNRGAFNTVEPRRDGGRVQKLLAPGRTVEHLQQMAIELWTTTTDGHYKSDRWWIAERVTVRTITVLLWKANYLDDVVTRRTQAASTDGVWRRVLMRIEPQVTRDEFHSWIRPLTVVDCGHTIQVGGSEVHVAWVQRHHRELVRQAVEAERPGTRVEFIADIGQKYG